MSKTKPQTNVVQLVPKAPAAQRELPLFQLNVLLTIQTAPYQSASAREVTDLASFLFERRLDTAQAHIALKRLIKRGLAAVEPKTKPKRFTVTYEGMTLAKATIATMRRVIVNQVD